MSVRTLIRLVVAVVVLAAVGAGGAWWWRDRSHWETTDNAFVQAETVNITPQIEGYVTEVLVEDNAVVRPGQVLARLDRADAEARLAQALAAVAAAHAAARGVEDRVSLEQSMIAERAASLTGAQAAAERARLDFERNKTLAERGFVSPQRLQDAAAASAQAAADAARAEAALESERKTAHALGSSRSQRGAEIAAAEAAARQARTDLERTEIRAPVGGVVGARSARPGQYVRPGTQMMAVVPLGETYVIANFKETQVARLRIGQPVEIRADAFGGEVITGRIESFAPATGSEFALIPVENAVGNFTKIAQRLPVRIVVDRASPFASALRPGLSLQVRADVTVQSGLSFAEAAQANREVAAGAAAAP